MRLFNLTKISPPWSLRDGPTGQLPSWALDSTRLPLETIELERQGGTLMRAAVFEVRGRKYVQATAAREPYLSQGAFTSGLRDLWPWGRWTVVKGHKLVAVAILPEQMKP